MKKACGLKSKDRKAGLLYFWGCVYMPTDSEKWLQ